MIKVTNEVEPYEVNEEELSGLKSSKQLLLVESHWNRNEFVVLKYNEVNITVKASDLSNAIKNATNSSRY